MKFSAPWKDAVLAMEAAATGREIEGQIFCFQELINS
jgi:hypothetical protein